MGEYATRAEEYPEVPNYLIGCDMVCAATNAGMALNFFVACRKAKRTTLEVSDVNGLHHTPNDERRVVKAAEHIVGKVAGPYKREAAFAQEKVLAVANDVISSHEEQISGLYLTD